jgi:sulfur relay (sulfurtransferase) DsrF/TusC family protein
LTDENTEAECGPDGDVCVIDTKKLIEERSTQGKSGQEGEKNSVLLLLTRGTYGRFDDAYGAILVANAALAKQQNATLILIGNGIYFAMKDQDPSDIFLQSNLPEISDFLELGGRIFVHRESIEVRGVDKKELIDNLEMIEDVQIVTEIEKHNVTLTF